MTKNTATGQAKKVLKKSEKVATKGFENKVEKHFKTREIMLVCVL